MKCVAILLVVIPACETVSQPSFVIARSPLDDVAISILSAAYEIATPPASRLAMTIAAKSIRGNDDKIIVFM